VAITEEGEGYCAPELLTGSGADVRADVYSLGATLYTLVTATQPVGSFPHIAEINPAARRFDRLVSRAMRAVIDDRPAAVTDFAKELIGTTEGVALPDRADDLAGWLEVLAYQPDHVAATETLAALEETYREKSDWENLVTLLLGRHEVEQEGATRVALIREVARIFEKEDGDQAKALTALLAGFREAPNNLEIQQDVERLAAGTGLWNEVVQEYSTVAQNQREPKAAGDWWVRIGTLYADKLGHDDYAIGSFNHALSLDANRLDALAALAEVVKQKANEDPDQYKEYAKLLSRMARVEDDPAQKAEILETLAQTYLKRLKSEEEAILAYRKVLDFDAAHAGAITALIKLFRKAEMWDELAELMRNRIPLTEVAEEQTRYRHELAEVYADHQEKVDDAIDVLSKVLEDNPDDAKALRILERLYVKTGRHDEYLAILDKRIIAAKDDAEKAKLYRRLAEESEAQPGGLSRAAEYLIEVHKLGKATEDNYRSLVRFYWDLKEYAKLVDVYGWHIEVAERPEDRAVLYAALGRVYDEHLKDSEKAIAAYNNMLAADDKNKIGVRALARLYEDKEVWAQAVQMLERLVKLETEKAEQARIYQKMGKLQAEKMGDLGAAETHLVKALELLPGHLETLLTLGKLYEEREDFGKAARMFSEAAGQSPNELDKVRQLYHAGELNDEKLGDKDKALDLYMEVLGLDPEHVDAGEGAAEILIARKAYAAALPLCEMLVRKTRAKERDKLLARNLCLGAVALQLDMPDEGEEAKAEAVHRDKALAAYRAAY
ncbi:MAG: hypothetical protein KAI47_19860, partial [Deltaproteobacteria bacterium]|nr:hypothetical protein [Deltaproteobacteria bacterium]